MAGKDKGGIGSEKGKKGGAQRDRPFHEGEKPGERRDKRPRKPKKD